MHRSFVLGILALCWSLAFPVLAAPRVDTRQVPQFKTEQAAQRHCPGDTVVWLNT